MDKHNQKAHNVIRMSEYQPETGYAALAQLEAYWEALRGTRLLPKRSEIDPRGIELALENAFILERIAPGIARLRIAGSHLNDLMGMEVRGMPLTSLFTAPSRRIVSDLLEDVFQMPACATLRLHSDGTAGRPALEARMSLLPLKSDLGDISRIIGCFVAQGDMGLAPRRFEVVSSKIDALGLQSVEPLPPEPTVAPPLPPRIAPQEAGFAEAAPRFERHPHPGDRKGEAREDKFRKLPPYLRVVEPKEDG
ncbi:MAG: PAS domain-containing protein [Sulfitobacter sp.]|nr:PAS domain-containing protein [Sulfitobacter sp.]